MKRFYDYLTNNGWKVEKDFEGEDCAIRKTTSFDFTVFIEASDKDLKEAFIRVSNHIQEVGIEEMIDGYIEDNMHQEARENGFGWAKIIQRVTEGLKEIVSIGILITNGVI